MSRPAAARSSEEDAPAAKKAKTSTGTAAAAAADAGANGAAMDVDGATDGEQDAASAAERSTDDEADAGELPSFVRWPEFPLLPPQSKRAAKGKDKDQVTDEDPTQLKLSFVKSGVENWPVHTFVLPRGWCTDIRNKDKAEKDASSSKASAAGAGKEGTKKSGSKDSSGKTGDDTKPLAERVVEKEYPDPAASSPLDSFTKLVSSVRRLDSKSVAAAVSAVAAESSPSSSAAADASAAAADAANGSSGALLDLQATFLSEVPELCQFTSLFHKQLYLRPVEPARLESMLSAPNDLTNETLYSELLSKLLYATRVVFPKGFRKRLEMMQQGQRVFHSQMLSEFMFWLVQLWIEQWARKLKRDELERQRGGQGRGHDDDEQDEEGKDGEREGDEAGAAKPRKMRKYRRKSVVAADSDSDGDDADENQEERDAYQLHTLPSRTFLVDTEKLCGNVNPFAPALRPQINMADAAAAADGAAAAAASPNVDAASSSVAAAASSSSSTAASPAPGASASSSSLPSGVTLSADVDRCTAPVLSSEQHKQFHEVDIAFRARLLQALCDYQLAVNPAVKESAHKEHESKELRLPLLGKDCHGKRYYLSGFPDFRVYVQGTVVPVVVGLSPEEEEEAVRKRAEQAKQVRDMQERVKQLTAELQAKQAAEVAREAAEKAAAKTAKKASKAAVSAMDIDEDAPLSLIAAKPVPPSSLATLPAPKSQVAAASSSSAAADSSAATAAAASSSAASSSANGAAAAALGNSPGLPFRLREPEVIDPRPRFMHWVEPAAPPFALLTSSAAEMRALISHVKSLKPADARNDALHEALSTALKQLEEGENAAREKAAEKKEAAAAGPKRVSDRLVGLELQREEQERLRASRFEEQSRNRDTRRNRWLDEQAQRCVAKLRRSYWSLMGVLWERKKGDSDEEEEEEESDAESQSHARSEATADEATGRANGRSSRNSASSGGRARGGKSRSLNGRTTRNQGRSTMNLAESDQSETESESDEWVAGAEGGEVEDDEEEEEFVVDDNDKGCEVCGTKVPPKDGTNPILLCENTKCDRQYCLKCIPLERVPKGKWFCDYCRAQNPRIR